GRLNPSKELRAIKIGPNGQRPARLPIEIAAVAADAGRINCQLVNVHWRRDVYIAVNRVVLFLERGKIERCAAQCERVRGACYRRGLQAPAEVIPADIDR